jgi:hypothetical protein
MVPALRAPLRRRDARLFALLGCKLKSVHRTRIQTVTLGMHRDLTDRRQRGGHIAEAWDRLTATPDATLPQLLLQSGATAALQRAARPVRASPEPFQRVRACAPSAKHEQKHFEASTLRSRFSLSIGGCSSRAAAC